ncbi:hypothetical protein [Streptomyces flavofungini]|uniref:hypothetical protein n=1 Tax=Streptomyces flavofungini TaxID=68200 RepID=UPI0025B2778A|nr:hypothetical protein [Streptomyces flavofungini]WJV48524.1 hypothetical protein QUY26_25185 [Streptomyces flavofungini]
MAPAYVHQLDRLPRTAHGTALGTLLDTAAPDCRTKLTAVAQRCQELAGNVTVSRTLSFD